MNTRIARRINDARRNEDKEFLRTEVKDMVYIYNQAVKNGLIDGLFVNFVMVVRHDNETQIVLRALCGYAGINDLYNMKAVWGADDIVVYTCGEEGSFALVFKSECKHE